jgi:uncharacterized protein (TIGR03084 family)
MSDTNNPVTLPQAQDFLDESNALYNLIKDLSDEELEQVTAFKHWTINDVIGHLHIWNIAAELSLNKPDEFQKFYSAVEKAFKAGDSFKDFERSWLKEEGRHLVELWREYFIEIAKRFSNADPKARVKWAGPDMSVRSSITARLMETWAHGQEVYDLLGVKRKNTDRIKNIVVLGVNTFKYTYVVRGEPVPLVMPFVKLTAPSGEIWTFGDENKEECIEGLAEEFCQVVTQTRNISDTELNVQGNIAPDWMSKAQCFAGSAETPPAAGLRKMNK